MSGAEGLLLLAGRVCREGCGSVVRRSERAERRRYGVRRRGLWRQLFGCGVCGVCSVCREVSGSVVRGSERAVA